MKGVLDWETAGVGHPLKDFDFGEWGYRIVAWERHFDVMRQRMWVGAASECHHRALPRGERGDGLTIVCLAHEADGP